MDLILTSYGTYLHRQGEMFVVKVKEQKQEVSSRKVRSIAITTGASLSTDAIQLAMEKNIDIVFLDEVCLLYTSMKPEGLSPTLRI